MDDMLERPVILVVDDEPQNISILGEVLRTDYIIRAATSGKKALEMVMSSDKPPDLILLDVMMPGLDGYSVCGRLKADKRFCDIPVIFVTAKCDEADEVKGFEHGAVDYVIKPFSAVVVRARVRTHIELKKCRDFLKNTSYCDGLTGIANRRRFNEYLESMWNLAVKRSLPLSLIMIDVDHFKLFNDNYGHQVADECLIQIAQKLASLVNRKTDLVARYGGEEFVCVLIDTKLDDAVIVAEEFRAGVLELEISHAYSSPGNYVTVSLGVAKINPSTDLCPDVLVTAADKALYQAKRSGRNKVVSAFL